MSSSKEAAILVVISFIAVKTLSKILGPEMCDKTGLFV
jgi:hypothetical protein